MHYIWIAVAHLHQNIKTTDSLIQYLNLAHCSDICFSHKQTLGPIFSSLKIYTFVQSKSQTVCALCSNHMYRVLSHSFVFDGDINVMIG